MAPWKVISLPSGSNTGSGFGAKSRGPGVLVVRNTVVTSGWRPSHSATWVFQAAHCEKYGSGCASGTVVSEHELRESW